MIPLLQMSKWKHIVIIKIKMLLIRIKCLTARFVLKNWSSGTSLEVQWLVETLLPTQRTWVWFLFGEPGSHMLQGIAKNLKTKQKVTLYQTLHEHIICMILMKVSVAQLCPTLREPVDCSPPGSSVHRILQARILEWVALLFSRVSSQPRDQTKIKSWEFIILSPFSAKETETEREVTCPRSQSLRKWPQQEPNLIPK